MRDQFGRAVPVAGEGAEGDGEDEGGGEARRADDAPDVGEGDLGAEQLDRDGDEADAEHLERRVAQDEDEDDRRGGGEDAGAEDDPGIGRQSPTDPEGRAASVRRKLSPIPTAVTTAAVIASGNIFAAKEAPEPP